MNKEQLILSHQFLVPVVMKSHYSKFIKWHGDDLRGCGNLALVEVANMYQGVGQFRDIAYKAISRKLANYVYHMSGRDDRQHKRWLSLDSVQPWLMPYMTDPLPGEEEPERQIDVEPFLCQLDHRQRCVVEWRHGIDCHPHTFQEIGDKLGVTKERAGQINKRALQEITV